MNESASELDNNLTTASHATAPSTTSDRPTALLLDDHGQAWVGGQRLVLSRRERAVLAVLVARQPGVVSKDEFAARVWAHQAMSDEGLAMCVSRLRRMLRAHGWGIAAEYGVGYRLQPLATPPNSAPPPPVHASYAHAQQLLEQRSPAAVGVALRLLRQVVAADVAHGQARIALADALAIAIGWGQVSTQGAVEEGLAALAAVQDPPLLPAAQAVRGALLDLDWRFDEAEACFQAALRLGCADTRGWLAYSRHQLYMNRPAGAVATLLKVRQLAPHALAPRMVLSRALILAGRGNDAVAEISAASQDHPADLALTAFELAIRAVVEPRPELRAAAVRLTQGAHTPIFVWSVSSYVLARLQDQAAAIDIVDAALACSGTTAGEAALYAAPLAELGFKDRAAALLRSAFEARFGLLAMVLRDPGNAHWLPHHPEGRALLDAVFGAHA